MWPNVKALQLVPLAAHALFARPLIIGSGSTFAIDILEDSTSDGWICCDGRRQCALPRGTRVEVRESKSTLRLAPSIRYKLGEQAFKRITDNILATDGVQLYKFQEQENTKI